MMNTEQLHKAFLSSSGVSTDTRNIKAESIFFALKGENFNGNTFAAVALDTGAAYAVIDEQEYEVPGRTILVTDVLQSLQDLASYHRKYLKIPIVALTGSNGKTTTKELIHAVLAQKFEVVATRGNLNNHIGVPLTLLRMNTDTEIGVIEMGANHQGEIRLLSKIANPDFGYITNFGKAHLEGFGGEEGVLKGKSELYDHIREHKGLLFVNAGDPKQLRQSEGASTFTFGTATDNDLELDYPQADPFARVKFNGKTVESQLIGHYNAANIAAAISIATYFKIEADKIKKAIEIYIPANNRSQILKNGRQTLILDAYNANPTSMEAALKNFDNLKADTKIAFLGDMFELGKEAAAEHQHIVDLTESLKLDQVILLGVNFGKTNYPGSFFHFKNAEELKEKGFPESVRKRLPQAAVLIKGSRGMALERILDLTDFSK